MAKPKTTSLLSMIIGSICLLVLFIIVLIKFMQPESSLQLTIENSVALIILGCSPALPFCPIFLNIIFDKIILLKHGYKESN